MRTGAGGSPSIDVHYDGTLDSNSAVAVRFNGVTLGTLPRAPGGGGPGAAPAAPVSVRLPIPLALVATTNQIAFVSANTTAMNVGPIDWDTGPVAQTVPGSPTPTPTACAFSYTDVPPGQPFAAYIRTLVCRNIVSGYSDHTFRPAQPVTRGQMTKFVAGAAGLSDPIPVGTQTFADVPPDQTYWVFVERLARTGGISGYACGSSTLPCNSLHRPYYLPGAPITRGQLSKIVANAAPYSDPPDGQMFEDVPAAQPFFPYIQRIALHGSISGYGCGQVPAGPCVAPGQRPYFNPNATVTRGQTAKIIATTFFPDAVTP